MSRIAIDITALRESAGFRRVFGAQLLSGIGSQITAMALMYQVWQITRSPLMVGMLGLAQVVPTVGFALVGGAIADAVDRRRLLIVVQLGMCACSLALAGLALGTPPLWSLYALAALSSGFHSVDGPARQSVIPMLVTDATLRSAVQLREVLTQSSRVFGPLVGGVVIAAGGLPVAYGIDALTFVVAAALFLRLPPLLPTHARKFELSSIVEGIRYVRSHQVLAGTFIADLVAMILGMPRAVFPALAAVVYHVGPTGLGLLYAAPAIGALVGILTFGGLTHRVRREGLAVLISVGLWGAFCAGVGFTQSLAVACALLACAGAADMVSAVFRQTILLDVVPDNLRGRMSSIHIMVVTGGPPLGDIEAGAAATWLGLRASVVAGGLACTASMGVLAVAMPKLTRWRRPEHAPPT